MTSSIQKVCLAPSLPGTPNGAVDGGYLAPRFTWCRLAPNFTLGVLFSFYRVSRIKHRESSLLCKTNPISKMPKRCKCRCNNELRTKNHELIYQKQSQTKPIQTQSNPISCILKHPFLLLLTLKTVDTRA